MEIVKSIMHPEEFFALVRFKLGFCDSVKSKCDYDKMTPTLRKCYEYLRLTSRSFAAVIQALDGELRHAVCIFYLVLRALDTVEDDMTIPLPIKVPMLKTFYTHLYDPTWNFTESKEKDRVVLEDFPTISLEFRSLDPLYRNVISDICRSMGEGMTVFFERELVTEEEWDEYCHYVAGLVGIGLSRLFSASKLEDEVVGQDERLANSMGLFLQKTNIIRDYLEDINQGRIFWPKSVWSKHGRSLADFKQPGNACQAVACLNELITNALQHVPDVIKYMSRIRNQSVFNFCAIPQVMAVATLERCYNNHQVFRGVVKIRKGEAVRLMFEATNMDNLLAIFRHFMSKIQQRIPPLDPSLSRTAEAASKALALTSATTVYKTSDIYFPLYVSFAMMICALLWHYWNWLSTVLERL